MQAEFFNDFVDPPHHYRETEKRDPMTKLLRRIAAGEVEPVTEPQGKPLVKRLLRELDIPVESQVLVFSKTSLQKRAVNPENPRAIYFNKEVYLGWMPGGRIEIGSVDPWLGSVFYFQRPLDEMEGPLFVETRRCMGCHAGSATNFLPGPLGRSVFPGPDGRSLRSVPHELTGHEIPIEDRWGGWYVTGRHGKLRHLGNAIAFRTPEGRVELDRDQFANLDRLEPFFSPEAFLYGDRSDLLALLLLDHQVGMHYRLMEAHYRARQAFFDHGVEDASRFNELPATLRREVREFARPVVSYLLFQDEAPLGDEVLQTDPGFREVFLRQAKRTPDGHSLRDLELDGHLFVNRCSYMLHSHAFLELPVPLKEAVYGSLHEILAGQQPAAGYEYLGAEERKRILKILRETVADWPRDGTVAGR